MTSLLGRRARGKHVWFAGGTWKSVKHEGEIVAVHMAKDSYYLLVIDAEHLLRKIHSEIVIEPKDHQGPLR